MILALYKPLTGKLELNTEHSDKLMMLQTAVVSYFFLVLCVSLSHAEHDDECSFSVTTSSMEVDLGEVTFLSPSDLGMGVVQCNCSNESLSVAIVLPDETVAVDSASIATMSSPGFASLNARMADLMEGIYTCRIDGEDTFYLYLLNPTGLASLSLDPVSQCTPAEGGGIDLNARLTGNVPQDLTCYENGAPVVDLHPQYTLIDRQRPTTTSIVIEFDPPTESTVNYACNSTSALGSFMFMCTLTGVSVPPTDSEIVVLTPPPLQSGNLIQIGSGVSAVAPLSQFSSSDVTATSPLWCQGASTSDSVAWRLPSGALLAHDSMNTDSVAVVPSSDANNVGIIPVGMNSFPSGVYTCIVNSDSILIEVGSDFMAPILEERRCLVQSSPNLILTILASYSSGIPSVINCVPTATQSTVLKPEFITEPLSTLVAVEFNPAVVGQTYMCSVMNDQGRGGTFSCSILANPTELMAVRDPDDPSTVTFSWQVPANAGDADSSITGYNLTLTSSNGTVIQSISVSSPNTSSITVNDVDVSQPISASIVSVSDSPDAVSSPTSSTVEVTRQCKPSKMFEIKLCLERPLNDGEESDDDMCTECSDASFAQAAFDVFLQSSCIDSTKCLSPAISNAGCECKKDKTKKSKKGKKGRKMDNDDDNEMRRICLEGELFCTSCEAYEPKDSTGGKRTGGKRRDGREVMRMRMKRKSGDRKRNNDLFDSENCSDVSVNSVNYSIEDESVKINANRGDYCGMTKLMKPAKSCDCPDSCSD